MIRLAPVLLGLYCTSACGAGDAGASGLSLSETRAAQAAFRSIQRRWFDADDAGRRSLRPLLERFLSRYPKDPRGANVRLLLAWALILEGRQTEAKRLLSDARSSSSPGVRDFAEVVEARLLIARQAPEAALAKLDLLAGKLVDAEERLVHAELRLQAALASRRFAQAVSALSSYLAAAPAELGDRARERATSAVKSLPDAVLESSMTELDAKVRRSALSPPEVWLRRVLRERLIRIAVDSKDAKLARRLLDLHPGLGRRHEASAQLMLLAGRASASAYSQSSFIGLALEVGEPDAERRSASVARGLSAALAASQPGRNSIPVVVRLASAHEVGATLSELSEAGAMALVAGLSDTAAEQAATWAVSGQAAVLLIRDTPDLVLSELSFVLGMSDVDQWDAIQKELARRSVTKWARVGSGGVDCRAVPASAGAGRFPVRAWKAEGVRALAVLAPRSCVMDLVSELRALNYQPVLALSLEGAEVLPFLGGGIALGAGDFPRLATGADVAPDFYEMLGHDAGVLLSAAAAQLALAGSRSTAPERASQVAGLLSRVKVMLQSTEATGFSGKRRLARQLNIKEQR